MTQQKMPQFFLDLFLKAVSGNPDVELQQEFSLDAVNRRRDRAGEDQRREGAQ